MTLRVGREQVLAYRLGATGLWATGSGDGAGTLDLGVQDTPGGSARIALAIRGWGWPAGAVLAWTFRGAPHVHRAGDLRPLALALWPRSEADGLAKISWERSRLQRTGMSIREALAVTAGAMRTEITEPTVKGVASAAVTGRLPPQLAHECRACRSTHVYESLFRMAALPAGIRLEPGASPATLVPVDDWPGVPDKQAGVESLVRTYLRLLGPAGLVEAARWLSTTRAELRPSWPDDLIEVSVEGQPAWIPEEQLDALRAATMPRVVRLLPPSDPYLQARDRDLLLPDRVAQKALWPALGPPGAVLVNGEIVGTWRTRAAGRRSLRVNVTPFGALFPDDRMAVDDQARIVAEVRGIAEVSVQYGPKA
jgi:Winged helix DNA-binding domain